MLFFFNRRISYIALFYILKTRRIIPCTKNSNLKRYGFACFKILFSMSSVYIYIIYCTPYDNRKYAFYRQNTLCYVKHRMKFLFLIIITLYELHIVSKRKRVRTGFRYSNKSGVHDVKRRTGYDNRCGDSYIILKKTCILYIPTRIVFNLSCVSCKKGCI